MPEFSGALARLADATLAIALLIAALQLLGSLSLLYFGWIVVGCIGVGLGAALLGRSKAPRRAARSGGAAGQTMALLIALGVASWTVAEWTFPSQPSLDYGMFGGDTTWYHMPFSAFGSPRSTRPSLSTSPTRCGSPPGSTRRSSELVNAGGDRALQERLALAAAST